MQVALTVVATFMNLPEAQIAASALESGGLHPLVMDQGWGSVVWVEQFALQGFRLAVPASEAADAIAFFRALPGRRTRAPRPARTVRQLAGAHWWRPVAAVLGICLLPYFGWLVVGFRPRRRRGSQILTAMSATSVAAIILLGLVFLVIEALVVMPAGLRIVLPLVAAVGVVVIAEHRKRELASQSAAAEQPESPAARSE
jgi:hypothetical protein